MKQILILGATSGIGRALALTFAQHNYHLILAGRDVEELERISRDIHIRNTVCVNIRYFDALDHDTHQHFWESLKTQGLSVDGVVLTYGYLGEQKSAEKDWEESQKILQTNFISCVSILNPIANQFESQQKGCICVLSSVAGDRGRQSNYVYGSAKGALSLYLQGLRNRLSHSGVTVLTVKPGFVDTKMTYGRIKDSPLVASPEYVAKSIYKAILKKKDIVYVPWFWKYMMFIIRVIPERWFKRLRL